MKYPTKQEFINAVLAEANVAEMLNGTDRIVETRGDYQKGYFEVLLEEPQGGQNFRPVWYITNSVTGETSYQTANTVNLKKNNTEARLDRLQKYLDANFLGSCITIFTGENWAEADVFENTSPTVTKKKVFVFKQGNSPVTHRDVIV